MNKPYYLLRGSSEKYLAALHNVSEQQEKEDEKEERQILCKTCRNAITPFSAIMDVDGSHEHTFTNPEGFVFRIGCFSHAPGCLVQGRSVLEFTWFAGFSWRYAHCSKCLTHLGWHYQAKDEENFYGLILDKLAEGSRGPSFH